MLRIWVTQACQPSPSENHEVKRRNLQICYPRGVISSSSSISSSSWPRLKHRHRLSSNKSSSRLLSFSLSFFNPLLQHFPMTADTLLPLQQQTAPLSVLHSWGRISTESRNEPEQLFIELEWICCFTVGRAETLCPAGPAELLTTTAYAPPPSATAPISFPLPRIEPNGFTSAECPFSPCRQKAKAMSSHWERKRPAKR